MAADGGEASRSDRRGAIGGRRTEVWTEAPVILGENERIGGSWPELVMNFQLKAIGRRKISGRLGIHVKTSLRR
jgi:hypothetical protein